MSYMNPVMRMIYNFLKLITRILLRLYYAKIYVFNSSALRQTGPMILVSNHPNTLIDALLVATRAKQPVFFLGHAGLFQTGFTHWFFSTFFTIPIKRKEDDTGGKTFDNEKSFEKCIEFLEKGGQIFIAPEGGSELERRIRRIKTGTARIALAAEKKNGYNLGVRILPVGLTYEDPTRFQTNIKINAGEAIEVSEFGAENEAHHKKTVRTITTRIQESLEALTVSIEPAGESVIFLFEAWQKWKGIRGKEAFYMGKSFVQRYHELSGKTRASIDEAVEFLDQAFHQIRYPFHKIPRIFQAQNNRTGLFLLVILGFPLFLYGLLQHIIPATIPLFILKKTKPHIGYHSTIKIVGGLFLFPLFYALQACLVNLWTESGYLTLLYVITLIPSGYFAWYYLERIKAYLKWKKLNHQNPSWKSYWDYFSDQAKQMSLN